MAKIQMSKIWSRKTGLARSNCHEKQLQKVKSAKPAVDKWLINAEHHSWKLEWKIIYPNENSFRKMQNLDGVFYALWLQLKSTQRNVFLKNSIAMILLITQFYSQTESKYPQIKKLCQNVLCPECMEMSGKREGMWESEMKTPRCLGLMQRSVLTGREPSGRV